MTITTLSKEALGSQLETKVLDSLGMSLSVMRVLTVRYAFRRHFYQHAGIRVAYTEDGKEVLTDFDPINKLENGMVLLLDCSNS
jgi:hypothetical protein